MAVLVRVLEVAFFHVTCSVKLFALIHVQLIVTFHVMEVAKVIVKVLAKIFVKVLVGEGVRQIVNQDVRTLVKMDVKEHAKQVAQVEPNVEMETVEEELVVAGAHIVLLIALQRVLVIVQYHALGIA